MKALYFEGEKGIQVIEKEIPEEFKKEADVWHKKMLERIASDHAYECEFFGLLWTDAWR